MDITAMKATVAGIAAWLASLFGGWDTAIATLVLFMAIDYISGLVVAGVFNNSSKTETGALESGACFKGLCRKGMALFVVMIACHLDLLIGTTFVRDAVAIGYIINETISIVENAGLMGIHVPEAITKAVDVLKDKDGE